MEGLIYKYRSLARITIEAATPLSICCGDKSIKTDTIINRDVNGLPFIPGTTIAGLVRHAIKDKEKRNSLMGCQEKDNSEGSRLFFTEAKILDAHSIPIDGLIDQSKLDKTNKDFIKNFKVLPIRQHTKISPKGITVDKGKFDEEIIYKGTRFCFEMELISEENEEEELLQIIDSIYATDFRIGGGSRSGFGKIKVVSAKFKTLNLSDNKDMNLYLNKSSSLSEENTFYQSFNYESKENTNYISYHLILKPKDFIFFNSGFGNSKADNTIVKERLISWSNKTKASFIEQNKTILIPASAIKGAISHRTTFHYNKLKGIYADEIAPKELQKKVGKYNTAVKELFGSEGGNGENKKRGNVLIADVLRERNINDKEKVITHVKIDRFTGGAIDGALFNEETLYAENEKIEIEILVNEEVFKSNDGNNIEKAFEQTLKDICTGRLPLGGGVNKGNGIFIGELHKNGDKI